MPVAVATETAAPISTPVHELVARRWSPKAFSARSVEPDKLRSLFEAARTAPSSYNEQPWRFIVATRERAADFGRLLSTLAERNARWAQRAPVLILSVAKLIGEPTGEPNRHAFHDVGQAVAYLTFQATALGLYLHQMGGFDAERARALLEIPEGYEPVAVIAVGYLDESADGIPPARSRRALEELVFSGRWGQPVEAIAQP
jgi:nitroreductase